MSPTTLPSARMQTGLRGSHVLGVFTGFFAMTFLVNGAMIYSAITTYSGLVANEPYRKGLHYNDRIAAAERQKHLGWIETVEIDRDGRVRVKLTDSSGHPVPAMKIAAVLGRPSTNRHDVPLKLAEIAPGQYEARTSPLAAGSWLLSLEARTDETTEPIYRLRRRLWLKP